MAVAVLMPSNQPKFPGRRRGRGARGGVRAGRRRRRRRRPRPRRRRSNRPGPGRVLERVRAASGAAAAGRGARLRRAGDGASVPNAITCATRAAKSWIIWPSRPYSRVARWSGSGRRGWYTTGAASGGPQAMPMARRRPAMICAKRAAMGWGGALVTGRIRPGTFQESVSGPARVPHSPPLVLGSEPNQEPPGPTPIRRSMPPSCSLIADLGSAV